MGGLESKRRRCPAPAGLVLLLLFVRGGGEWRRRSGTSCSFEVDVSCPGSDVVGEGGPSGSIDELRWDD